MLRGVSHCKPLLNSFQSASFASQSQEIGLTSFYLLALNEYRIGRKGCREKNPTNHSKNIDLTGIMQHTDRFRVNRWPSMIFFGHGVVFVICGFAIETNRN